jgi:putative transposase
MVSVPVRREQVAYAQRRGPSQQVVHAAHRGALGAELPARATKDAPVLARMAALSAQYPRYGYRRIRIFLGRDGHPMSPGRAWRLGGAPGCRSRARGHANASPAAGRGPRPRPAPTRCGPTTSSSTGAPTASNSSA